MTNDGATNAHDSEALTEAAREAIGIAYLLASAAYLTLADAYLEREGEAGLELMMEIEANLTNALRRFATEAPQDGLRPDIVLLAASKFRALMEAGRQVPAKATRLH